MEEKKKLLWDAIKHKPVRVPTMYRGGSLLYIKG